tara:strand:+ start:705 stop:1133 length:429 start_codon:yes stop_codon:yes gene_type:complete
MVVRDAMCSLTKISAAANVNAAAKIMDEKNVAALLVEEEGEFVGIVTERDILRKVVASGKVCGETKMTEIMNSPLIKIDVNSYLENASDLIAKHKVRRLVVTEGSPENIIGIVTARSIAEKTRFFLAKRLKKGSSYAGKLSR